MKVANSKIGKSVVLIGAGGSGREVLEILKDLNKKRKPWDILGFIDENEKLHGKTINGYPVLGGIDWLKIQNPRPSGTIPEPNP